MTPLDVPCLSCGAKPGQPCTVLGTKLPRPTDQPHHSRRLATCALDGCASRPCLRGQPPGTCVNQA